MNNKTMTTKAEKLSRLIPKEGGEEVPTAAAQISRCDGMLPVTHAGGIRRGATTRCLPHKTTQWSSATLARNTADTTV